MQVPQERNDSIKFGPRSVGPDSPPLVIVELSGNHGGSLDKMLQLVDAAAAAGAEMIKLQTYTADTMTIDFAEREFFISDPGSLWKGQSLYDLYKKASTPWDWHKPIFDRARAKGMQIFSTPFDATAVDFLETLNVPCYKVASFEMTDVELVKKIATTGKPVIISTGMAQESEIAETVAVARQHGIKDLILLKCTSSYPADPKDSNLNAIPLMREKFQCQIGLSDHTIGTASAIASVALGATVIEKHFNISRDDGAVDADFSATPQELTTLIADAVAAWQSMGQAKIGPSEAEKKSLVFRRSLYVVEDIQPGDAFTPKNVRAIRPGYGLPIKHLSEIIGKKAKSFVARGTPVNWDIVQ